MRLTTQIIILSLLAGCSSQFQAVDYLNEPSVVDQAASARDDYYRVRAGDTLYTIALRNDLNYRKLAAANGILPPYQIQVGQRLRLQEANVPVSLSENNQGVTQGNTGNVTSENQHSNSGQVSSYDTYDQAAGQVSWVWPHNGDLLHNFRDGSPFGKGIALEGEDGDVVRAAADGQVVYSGNGLRSYGNLILIQHTDNLLSAYAFLSGIRVAEQQSVQAGDVIAEVGLKESARILHFEIRRDGKPVDPESLLPAK